MRFFSKNIYRSIITHWKANLLILADLILCALMIFIMLQNYSFAAFEYRRYYGENELSKRYVLSVDHDGIDNPYNVHSPMYEVTLQVKEELCNNPLWTSYYIALFTLPTNLFIPSLPDSFDIQNNPAIYPVPGETGVNGYLFSEHVMRVQNIRLHEGQGFTEEDYQVRDLPIHMIMGYDFKSYYEVGDILSNNEGTLVVTGFMEKNSFFFDVTGDVHNLDKSVVVPILLTSDTSFAQESQLVFTLGGELALNDPQTDVQKELNRITSRYGYYGMTCEPLEGSAYTNTEIITRKNIALLMILSVISSILCLTALSNILYKRTLTDQATICTYLLSGIPLWKINLSVIIELTLWTGLSVLPAIALSYLEFGQLFISPAHVFGVMALLVAISLIPVFIMTGKINLDLIIRSRNE